MEGRTAPGALTGRMSGETCGERLMTDGELATALRVSPRALRDYRNEGILPYIRMKGNILYRESDVERVLKRCIRGKMTLQSG